MTRFTLRTIAIVACSPADDEILFIVNAAVLSTVTLNAQILDSDCCQCFVVHNFFLIETDSNDIAPLFRYRYSCEILHTEKVFCPLSKSLGLHK